VRPFQVTLLSLFLIVVRQEMSFCLSNGRAFIFFVLKRENGIFSYYESIPILMGRKEIEVSDQKLREIVQLLLEWVNRTSYFFSFVL